MYPLEEIAVPENFLSAYPDKENRLWIQRDARLAHSPELNTQLKLIDKNNA